MANIIEVDDEEMKLMGKKIANNLFFYNDQLLRLVRTHQTKSISYYVAEDV